jgi:hypothetical protein
MQFTGAKGITLFVAIIAIVCMAGFGSGVLVGRQFPAHHFEKMENSHYLYDTSTGHVCDFWPAKTEASGANEQSDFLKSLNENANNSIPPCNH